MYSTYNERKSIVTERFIRTLKNKIHKYMTSISKNVYIDKLDEIVQLNTTINIIKMKPVDVKPSMYINFNKENNNRGPKFKVGDNVRISKYKRIFIKGYVRNQSGEVFVIKKVKNTVSLTYVISDFNGEKFLDIFAKKNCKKKKNQKEFTLEKVIKRKGDNL